MTRSRVISEMESGELELPINGVEAFRSDTNTYLVDWGVVFSGSSCAYLPLQWVEAARVNRLQPDVMERLQRKGRVFGSSREVETAFAPNFTSDAFGWSAAEDVGWRRGFAEYKSAHLKPLGGGEQSSTFKAGATARIHPWWGDESMRMQVEEAEEEESTSGSKRTVVYSKRKPPNVGDFIVEDDDEMEAGDERGSSPRKQPRQGLMEQLQAVGRAQRAAQAEEAARLSKWQRMFGEMRQRYQDVWPSWVPIVKETKQEQQLVGFAQCGTCGSAISCATAWNGETFVGNPHPYNLRRHQSANPHHAAPRQQEVVELQEPDAVAATALQALVVPVVADTFDAWFARVGSSSHGWTTLTLGDIPAAHVGTVMHAVWLDVVAYLSDATVCHQPNRYRSQKSKERLVSVVSKGFGAYWTSPWFRAQCNIKLKSVDGTLLAHAWLSADVTELTYPVALYTLLRACLDMETVVHTPERWDVSQKRVSLTAPTPSHSTEFVKKKLGGTASKAGQMLEAASGLSKGLDHVEFLSCLLVRAMEHQKGGVPAQYIEASVRELQTLTKRHQAALRKQSLSLRHQLFRAHLASIFNTFQVAQARHLSHVQVLGAVVQDLAELQVSNAQEALHTLRERLYSSSTFVEYVMEALMVMFVLEHGVQRTQVYRELVLLNSALDSGALATLAGKFVAGLVEEQTGAFFLVVAADKIQNAGVLKVPFSHHGSVVLSVLFDLSAHLLRTHRVVSAGRAGAQQRRDDAEERLEHQLLNDEMDEEEAGLFDIDVDSDDEEPEAVEAGVVPMEEEEEEEEEVEAAADAAGANVVGMLDTLLRPALLEMNRFDDGNFQAIKRHPKLFALFRHGIEKQPVAMSTEKLDLEALDNLIRERAGADVLPAMMENWRVARAWWEEYLSVLTAERDPMFVRDSAMMRRHSAKTVYKHYAPAHEENVAAELIKRQAVLLGKRAEDFPRSDVASVVALHLDRLQHGMQPVPLRVRHAVKIMSAARRGDTLQTLKFDTLLRDHAEAVTMLEENPRHECVRVPVPTYIKQYPVLLASYAIDIPVCSACQVPMMVSSLAGCQAVGETLRFEETSIKLEDEAASVVARLVRHGEIQGVVLCERAQLDPACKDSVAFLTFNSLETNAVYAESLRQIMFVRNE